MKSLLLYISLFIVTSVQSQTKIFVRIFDEAGKKIYKGYLIQTSDSSLLILKSKDYPLFKTLGNQLTLSKNTETYEIPITQITTIKLRRGFGHTVIMTTLFTGVSFAFLGAAILTGDYFYGYVSEGAGAIAGLILGAASGTVIGSIVAGTRSRPAFKINRNQEQWMKSKSTLNSYLQAQSN